MKIHYNNWPVKREWEDKDIREYMDSDAWDYLNIEHLNFNIDYIREFKDKINWDVQYYNLRDMWDRWSLKDQTFFKEFRSYIAKTIDAWDEFGKFTGITHDY